MVLANVDMLVPDYQYQYYYYYGIAPVSTPPTRTPDCCEEQWCVFSAQRISYVISCACHAARSGRAHLFAYAFMAATACSACQAE